MSDNSNKPQGWIGVDFDGTLAVYDGWRGIDHIGEPIPAMVERVRNWLAAGWQVRILTARVGPQREVVPNQIQTITQTIQNWCIKHLGQALPVTASKDFEMRELWDDRAVTVEMNTGRVLVEGVE